MGRCLSPIIVHKFLRGVSSIMKPILGKQWDWIERNKQLFEAASKMSLRSAQFPVFGKTDSDTFPCLSRVMEQFGKHRFRYIPMSVPSHGTAYKHPSREARESLRWPQDLVSQFLVSQPIYVRTILLLFCFAHVFFFKTRSAYSVIQFKTFCSE